MECLNPYSCLANLDPLLPDFAVHYAPTCLYEGSLWCLTRKQVQPVQELSGLMFFASKAA